MIDIIVEGTMIAKAHEGDSGYDLKSAIALTMYPGDIRKIPTGTKIQLPKGYEGQVRSRSGLALKHGIHCMNSPGTVDSIFRGDVGVILHHAGTEPFVINIGDRVAQLVIAEVPDTRLVPGYVDATERGADGFGSTGK